MQGITSISYTYRSIQKSFGLHGVNNNYDIYFSCGARKCYSHCMGRADFWLETLQWLSLFDLIVFGFFAIELSVRLLCYYAAEDYMILC